MRRFKKLPRRILRGVAGWIEPLKLMQNSLLDCRRHPFYSEDEGAEAEFFLARNGRGECVGRVAAIINHRFNAHSLKQGEEKTSGFFGFFDCINSRPVAAALLDTAAGWLREKGVSQMLGPASPSENYDYGILVEGYDQPHRFLLPYHPPYYAELMDGCGMTKVKDLLGLSLDMQSSDTRETLKRFFKFIESAGMITSGEINIRPVDMSRFDEEIRLVSRLFSKVLGGLWGHTPIGSRELSYSVMPLRHFIIPDTILVAERKGEPVGVVLNVPDLNEIIRKIKLRIGWLEAVELYIRSRFHRPDCMRTLVLGVAPGYEKTMVLPAIISRLAQTLFTRGIRYVDAHLVQEDNKHVVTPLLRYDFRPNRRFRIYRRDL